MSSATNPTTTTTFDAFSEEAQAEFHSKAILETVSSACVKAHEKDLCRGAGLKWDTAEHDLTVLKRELVCGLSVRDTTHRLKQKETESRGCCGCGCVRVVWSRSIFLFAFVFVLLVVFCFSFYTLCLCSLRCMFACLCVFCFSHLFSFFLFVFHRCYIRACYLFLFLFLIRSSGGRTKMKRMRETKHTQTRKHTTQRTKTQGIK